MQPERNSRNDYFFRDVAARMFVARLPLHYVRRSVSELRAHVEDAEEYNPGANLGISSEKLVDEFVSTYRHSRWSARLPSFVWIALVVPLSLFVCLGYFGAMALTLEYAKSLRALPQFDSPLLWLFYFGKIATPLLSYGALAWLSRYAGLRRWAYVTIVVVLAVLFGVTVSEFRLPTHVLGGELLLHVDDEVLARANPFWQLSQSAMILIAAAWHSVSTRTKRRRFLGDSLRGNEPCHA